MLLYVITIIVCFLADYFHKRNKALYIISVVWIYSFLCFGYMVGSDWRNYELIYTNADWDISFNKYEVGNIFLFNIFRTCHIDFWLFTGIMKSLFLFSSLLLSKIFSKNKWSVIGVSIIMGSLLFMVIDCPFRFMLASTVINFAMLSYIKRKNILAIVLSFVAITFHIMIIIPALLLFTTKFAAIFSKINNRWLLIAYLLLYYIILQSSFIDYIYNVFLPLTSLDVLYVSYVANGLVNGTSGFLSLGNILQLLLFIILVSYKQKILLMPKGEVAFYFSVVFFFISLLAKCIPTGFRLAIFAEQFVVICFAYLLFSIPKFVSLKKVSLYFALTMCLYTCFRDINNSYSYIPYSNSIFYILTEHKPYSQRSNYNFDEYFNRFGYSVNN